MCTSLQNFVRHEDEQQRLLTVRKGNAYADGAQSPFKGNLVIQTEKTALVIQTEKLKPSRKPKHAGDAYWLAVWSL